MRKMLANPFLSLTMVLSALSFPFLVQDQANIVAAQDAASTAPLELMEPAEAMVLALNQKGVDKAFSVMTDKGADQYMGMMLLQFAQLSQMGGIGEPSEELKQFQEMVTKYGLDQVQIDMPMPNSSGSAEKIAEEFLRTMQKAEKQLLECIPAAERRKATQELVEASSKFMISPISFAVGDCEINGDNAELQVVAKVSPEMAEQGGGDMDGQPMAYLLFIKDQKGWRFDGFNNKRMIDEMVAAGGQVVEPFKEIADLTIEGKTIDGQELSLASYKGKVVLVDFWGTWCGPCVAGIPKLTALHEKYQPQGFEILGVAADDVESLKAFLEKKPMAWKNVLDGESDLATKYSIVAYPTTLLVDRQGKHVATNLHGETLEKAVKMLLEGKTIESLTGNAAEILEAGKKQAIEEKKLVFLHFGADWCGPCKMLEEWMAQPEIHSLLEKAFIDVRIDFDNNIGAQELMAALSPKAEGIPWYAILDATAESPIATCEEATIGNIGFPDSKEGVDHFVKMFAATKKFSNEQLELIRTSISTAGEKIKSETSK